jgi:transcription elongation factor Elf1
LRLAIVIVDVSEENSRYCPGIVCNPFRFQTLTRRGQKGLRTRPIVGLVSNMSRSPRASYANMQGAESKKSSRPDPKVVHASSPQLFRCPRCSAMSFRVLFRDRDVAGICTECSLQLRTDRRIGRATREYYADFNRQVGDGDSERIERIFLKMNSVSEAKRVYPVVRRLGYRTKQSSPMLHARLVMVETTRDRALVLIEKLRERGLQVALQDNFQLPQPEHVLPAASIRKA